MAADLKQPSKEVPFMKRLADHDARKGHWKAALARYRVCLGLGVADLDVAALHANCSLCALKLGDTEVALLHADRAVALRPEWSKAHGRRGAALEAAGRLAGAQAAYTAAVACTGGDGFAANARRLEERLAQQPEQRQEKEQPHLFNCGCGCGPRPPSLFEMARRRAELKKRKEEEAALSLGDFLAECDGDEEEAPKPASAKAVNQEKVSVLLAECGDDEEELTAAPESASAEATNQGEAVAVAAGMAPAAEEEDGDDDNGYFTCDDEEEGDG